MEGNTIDNNVRIGGNTVNFNVNLDGLVELAKLILTTRSREGKGIAQPGAGGGAIPGPPRPETANSGEQPGVGEISGAAKRPKRRPGPGKNKRGGGRLGTKRL